MQFKYNQATHQLIQLPEMKEPDNSTGWSEDSNGMRYKDEYHRLLDKEVEERYKKHIASLKTYDVGVDKVPDYWKVEGQILGEKDFRIDNISFMEDGTRCDNNSDLAVSFKTVAIPIQEENKAENMILECDRCSKKVNYPVFFCDDQNCPMKENKKVEEEITNNSGTILSGNFPRGVTTNKVEEEGWSPSGNIPCGKTWGFPPKEWEKEKEDEVRTVRKNTPRKIYLQIGDEVEDDENFNNLSIKDILWCSERQFPNDIEYNLVECKEKDSQDELWKHVFDVFLSKGDVYIWDYKAAVTELQNEQFSIYKK